MLPRSVSSPTMWYLNDLPGIWKVPLDRLRIMVVGLMSQSMGRQPRTLHLSTKSKRQSRAPHLPTNSIWLSRTLHLPTNSKWQGRTKLPRHSLLNSFFSFFFVSSLVSPSTTSFATSTSLLQYCSSTTSFAITTYHEHSATFKLLFVQSPSTPLLHYDKSIQNHPPRCLA